MNPLRLVLLGTLLAACGLLGQIALADEDADAGDGRRFEITVTNLTRGQQFTPILVATHTNEVNLFTLGTPASPQLARLAEEGDTGPLFTLLVGMSEVKYVAVGAGLTNPGQSKTVIVRSSGKFRHMSVAAMLIPTNDGFFSINNVEGPNGDQVLTLFSPAYDAGSERNDELCSSIPGPFFTECGGPGGGAKVGGGEGYVHIHAGIHGIGNLDASQRDWRNPVAKITIRRIP